MWLENAENKAKELEDEVQNKHRLIKDGELEISKLRRDLEFTRLDLEQKKSYIDELKSIIAAKDVEKDRAVFEATKHLAIKIGVLEAMLKPQP